MIRIQFFAVCLLIFMFTACESESRIVPLPKLPEAAVLIRVAYAINPRFPQMTPAQIQLVLVSMRKAVMENFGVALEFSTVDIIPIASLFEKIPENKRAIYAKDIYDFRGNANSRELEITFGLELKMAGESLEQMITYSRPYIGVLPEKSYTSLGSALAKYQLGGMEQWRKLVALDGKPSIDAHPYNEFMMWLALGYGEVPYELILTNQLIASVETRSPGVHAALRGGYSNGVTTYNKQSRYGTMSVWSTYAFTANDAWTKKLREGEIYSATEAAQLAGLSAAHEIGHQLFHLLHPYTQTSCIMYPVPMLAFRRWANNLSAKDCPLGSVPEMKPGAYQFYY